MGDTLKELENSPALKKWLLENVEKMITYHSEQLSQWEKLLQQINNLPSVNKSEKKPTTEEKKSEDKPQKKPTTEKKKSEDKPQKKPTTEKNSEDKSQKNSTSRPRRGSEGDIKKLQKPQTNNLVHRKRAATTRRRARPKNRPKGNFGADAIGVVKPPAAKVEDIKEIEKRHQQSTQNDSKPRKMPGMGMPMPGMGMPMPGMGMGMPMPGKGGFKLKKTKKSHSKKDKNTKNEEPSELQKK